LEMGIKKEEANLILLALEQLETFKTID
jgi:hypothetical protein